MQKTMLSWGILALALTSFTPMVRAQKKEPTPAASVHSSRTSWDANHQYLDINEDSTTNPPQIIATYKSDALYNMVISGGKLTSLYVNGRQIPADGFYVYDGLVKKIKDQLERDRKQAIRDREQAVRDREQAGRDEEQAGRDKKQAEKDAEQALRDKAQADRDAQQAGRDREQAAREAVDAKAEAARDMEQAVRDKKQAERDMEQAGRDREQAGRDREQAIRDKKQAEEDRALLKALLTDVVKEGLAPDEKSIVSLTLDESVFFINGKKQSDELQKKFLAKFIKKEGYSIHIHNGMTNIGRVED